MTDAGEMIDGDDIRWWRRLRSAVLLGLLTVVLGVLTAAVLGIAVVGTFSLLDHALG